jgi:hypothetical protein
MTIASYHFPRVHFLLLLAIALPVVADSFCIIPPVGRASSSSVTTLFSKKNPKGAPITVQEDEDAAMWIEEKGGKVKKALKNPVGGRPINKVTKDQLQQGNKGAKNNSNNKPWWKI